MSERKPAKHVVYERIATPDGRRVRFNAIRGFWKRACFSRKEVDSGMGDGSLKKVWVPNSNHVSLKAFARSSTDEAVKAAARDWFHNKRANVSNPPQGIGCTRKKKGSSK